MIKSMTGFASLTREDETATIAVSVKTVNHRFLDVQVRVPQALADIEPRVRQWVQTRVSRGRVEVSISVQYLDHDRFDDVGVSPFEVKPYQIADAKKETKTSRADVNALKVLRQQLREGILAAYQKLEPRLRDALRDRADMGHDQVQVTVDLRPAE